MKETVTKRICNAYTCVELIKNKRKRLKQFNPYNFSRLYNLIAHYPVQWKVKRIIDYSGSFLGLILLFPVFLLIAAMIKLESKGSILYKQERIGLYGEKFFMYKFRSMKTDADKEFDTVKALNETNSGMFKLTDDPRMTRVGKFLRKYSLDEFPQLLNVLKGEMSLVGPRPPLERELSAYKYWHYLRFGTIPGLTGLWQTSGRSTITDFDKVVELDRYYITHWSLLLDIKLLFKTIPIVLFGKDSA
ncbi:MAG: sugar transferase [bacterium]